LKKVKELILWPILKAMANNEFEIFKGKKIVIMTTRDVEDLRKLINSSLENDLIRNR
jgi:hypothetical protein